MCSMLMQVSMSWDVDSVSEKKTSPFLFFCDIFVRFHPILLIFGRNIPQEI